MVLKWKTDSFLLFHSVRCFVKLGWSLFSFVLVQNSNVYLVYESTYISKSHPVAIIKKCPKPDLVSSWRALKFFFETLICCLNLFFFQKWRCVVFWVCCGFLFFFLVFFCEEGVELVILFVSLGYGGKLGFIFCLPFFPMKYIFAAGKRDVF